VDTRSPLPEHYKLRRKLIEKEEYDRIIGRKPGFLDWLSVKQQQYNITSVLYVLDWWEKILFNIFMFRCFIDVLVLSDSTFSSSVLFGTVFAMSLYSQSSGLLLALSIFLMGVLILLLLLCPLHQY